VTAGAAMMLGGAILLALSAGFGEMSPMPHISLRGGLALLYLVVFGSLMGFTAFIWLLARMPAARVASHAYVNPIVAVALGYFAAGETITLRMLAGMALVIVSVVLILRPSSVEG
jgi:drug/metabolite transporter (DMT)-like permease